MILILSTVPNRETALTIAQSLVEKKLVACVHLSPTGLSVYEWEGKLCQAEEVQLWAKTEDRLWTAARDEISRLHPFEIPQILGLNVSSSLGAYEDWLKETLKS